MSETLDTLLSGQLLVSMLVLGSVYGLVALGLNLIYGSMRLLNIAHGEIMMLGAYVGFWAFTLAAIPPYLAMVVSMVLAAGLGALLYVSMLGRVISRTTSLARLEANSLLIFFGLSVILQNLASLAFTSDDRSYPWFDQILQLGPVSISADRLMVMGVALGATLAVIAFFRFTLAGLAIRALIQQRDAAQLVGINVRRLNMMVTALGFALAALAGTLIGMVEQVSPFSGFPYTIAAFVVIILGGLGHLYGGLIGALALAAIETYGVAFTSASLRSLLVYGVFIAILLIRPQGLFGARRVA